MPCSILFNASMFLQGCQGTNGAHVKGNIMLTSVHWVYFCFNKSQVGPYQHVKTTVVCRTQTGRYQVSKMQFKMYFLTRLIVCRRFSEHLINLDNLHDADATFLLHVHFPSHFGTK